MKRLILLLYFIFATVSPSFAVVMVSVETTRFATQIDSSGITSSNLSRGSIIVIFGCGSHQWRKGWIFHETGFVHLNDVELVFGRFPSCSYIPTDIPPSDTPEVNSELQIIS
jgi:hypothetical protein